MFDLIDLSDLGMGVAIERVFDFEDLEDLTDLADFVDLMDLRERIDLEDLTEVDVSALMKLFGLGMPSDCFEEVFPIL